MKFRDISDIQSVINQLHSFYLFKSCEQREARGDDREGSACIS